MTQPVTNGQSVEKDHVSLYLPSTRAEQAELYRRYQNGTGNLAAPPGQSNHEHGDAADAYINGVALANVAGAREAAQRLGLHFPVGGEAWHVERSDL